MPSCFSHLTSLYSHQPVYSLRLDDVRKLHEMMTLLYEVWLRNAPQGWFKDTFFTDSKPMAITSLFGQDQPIAVAGHEELECENWEAERDYTQIRSISIALATHVSYVLPAYPSAHRTDHSSSVASVLY